MNAPDLLYTEVQDDLRRTVRKVFGDRSDPAAVLARCESEQPYDLPLWTSLAAELGLAGLAIPEEHGGAGASAREVAVFAEELGRSVAPVPFLGSAVLASTMLLRCTDSPSATALLSRLVTGAEVATVAVPLTSVPHCEFPAAVTASGASLRGTVNAVVDLRVADQVVVPAVDEEGPALYLLDVTRTGVRTVETTSLDLTRRVGRLECDGARAEKIAGPQEAPAALHDALSMAAGILSCEQVGLAQLCLDSTVEYSLTRYQFGRPIGSFQAVKHRLADLWTGVSTARAVARHAADALSRQDGESDMAVAVAQAYCSDVVVLAAEECLQLHGGIGMTWEHPTHLYLGRAKSSQLAFGIAERHRARIAELTDLPAS